MVIAGSNALTLPKLDCATVFVELSKTERKLYDMAKKHCVSKIQARVSWQGTGVDMFGFDMLANDAKQCLAGSFKHFESMRGKLQQVNNYAEFEVGHEKRRSHRALISKATKAIPSKLKALLDDLLALGEVEPAFQAVVFTRSTETHARYVILGAYPIQHFPAHVGPLPTQSSLLLTQSSKRSTRSHVGDSAAVNLSQVSINMISLAQPPSHCV